MDLKEILRKVNKPARYIDHEEGSCVKPWTEVSLKACLCFPDKYEIGMSNMGMEILYFLGNDVSNAAVERCYAPDLDLVEILRKQNQPLFALESKKPLKDFDLVCFSLQHELTHTNMLLMLDLGGIPLLKKDRSETDPLVIVGGPSAFNPEPLADFIDIAVVGEGEEVFVELLKALAEKKLTRTEKLKYLQNLNLTGVYFPDLKNVTQKAFVKDLNNLKIQDRKIIPYIDVVHNRCAVEIMRGCIHGCRFCQAGFILRPQRHKTKDRIIQEAETQLNVSGLDEISLLSLSTTDHPEIEPLLVELNKKFAGQNINISLPSVRTDSISENLLREIQKVRKSTITIAPEAGTQRLRDVVHKEMTEENIEKAFILAVESGARSVKMYFMIGLPTETDEDVRAIPQLAERLLAKVNTRNIQITINVSNFVPRPHTPFQWARMCDDEELRGKQRLIKEEIKIRRIQAKFHHTHGSLLEGFFSRGDRRLGQVILKAYQSGCIFDAWQENLDYEKWLAAFSACRIDPLEYLKERDQSAELPWDNIQTGVPKGYLLKEYLQTK